MQRVSPPALHVFRHPPIAAWIYTCKFRIRLLILTETNIHLQYNFATTFSILLHNFFNRNMNFLYTIQQFLFMLSSRILYSCVYNNLRQDFDYSTVLALRVDLEAITRYEWYEMRREQRDSVPLLSAANPIECVCCCEELTAPRAYVKCVECEHSEVTLCIKVWFE